MKLIGSTTSPYVRKVRVVMAEKKLDYRFVEDNVWADDSTITAANPLGKVPCLVLDGGDAMFDSRVIVEYLDTLSGRRWPTACSTLPSWCGWSAHLSAAAKPSAARPGSTGNSPRCRPRSTP